MAKHYSKFTNDYTKIYYKGELISPGLDGYSRDPLTRIKVLPIDFTNKTVLDLGCNCGGTLFAVADKIKQGYGNDINPDAIQYASDIARKHNINNVSFSVANLANWKDYNLPKTDIVFALAIAKWVQPWRDILKYLDAPIVVFESHGKGNMQPDQVQWLNDNYSSVELLLEGYEKGKRKLFLCKK
jgi:SAM-dependent methyltransferase